MSTSDGTADQTPLTHILMTRKFVCELIANRLILLSRVTFICISKLSIIGSDDGLSRGRHWAVIWTNVGILLTHWGRVTHICVGKLTNIGSDNGLSPGRCQAIIWTNVGILLTGPFVTNFSEILIEIYKFSFKNMHLKMSSGNWQPFCLGLKVLRYDLPPVRHQSIS